MFLSVSDRDYVSGARYIRMYRFNPPLIVMVPQDSNIALHAQVC